MAAFVKIQNGEVVDGPLLPREIKQRWPNTSFPINSVQPPEDGWVELARTAPVIYGEFEVIDHYDIQEVDGAWRKVAVMRPMTAEEITRDDEVSAQVARRTRNRLLAESDYTQLADYPNPDKALWATYRQELRDLPNQAGFPRNPVFPDKPGQP